MGVNASIEGSNPSFSASWVPTNSPFGGRYSGARTQTMGLPAPPSSPGNVKPVCGTGGGFRLFRTLYARGGGRANQRLGLRAARARAARRERARVLRGRFRGRGNASGQPGRLRAAQTAAARPRRRSARLDRDDGPWDDGRVADPDRAARDATARAS